MSDQLAVLIDDINGLRHSFESYQPPPHINFQREAGFAIQILQSSDWVSKIAFGNRQSLADAVTNVAALGISLNPEAKQAYLLPRKIGNKYQVTLVISYRGLVDLAVEGGGIEWAQARVVRMQDGFRRNGFDQQPTFDCDDFASDEERGDIRGVFVVAKTAKGSYLTHTMSIQKVWDIRERSESWKAYVGDSKKNTPWVSDEEEMIKKTCLRQAAKSWPRTQSGRLEKAIHYLETTGGEGIDLGDGNTLHEATGETTTTQGAAHVAPTYADEQFQKNLPTWKKLVASGKRTPEEIIATVSSGAVLTEAQKRAINNLKPLEMETAA